MTKTLLIGWDAADWQFIDPLIRAGEMPTLALLLQKGVRGNLATLRPPLSPLLWTSMVTGHRPHRHGVLGFTQGRADGSVVPVRADRRRCKALWNIFGQAGMRSLVVNWWPSYPLEEMSGLMVSNHFAQWPREEEAWNNAADHVAPAHYAPQLADLRLAPAELTWAQLQPFFPQWEPEAALRDPLVQKAAGTLCKAANVQAAATELLEGEDFDFAAVYFEALDHFSHLAMTHHQAPEASPRGPYSDVLRAAYRFHDMMLERLWDLAGPDANLILVSDHGFAGPQQLPRQKPALPAAPAFEHRPYGLFAATGPGFQAGQTIYGASLLDVCPTLLHLHQLPVGEDMPGRVLLECFRRPGKLSRIPSWEDIGPAPRWRPGDSQDPGMLRTLQDLGYLSGQETLAALENEWAYNAALSLHDAGEYRKALKKAKALEQAEAGIRLQLLLAELELRCGYYQAVEKRIHQWPEAWQNHPFGLFLRGLSALEQGRGNEALSLFQRVEEKTPASPQLQMEMGKALAVTGHSQAAEDYFSACLQQEGDNPAALTARAELLLYRGERNQAVRDLQRSLSLRHFQPQAHYLLGCAFAEAQEIDAAKKAWQICLQQAPKYQKARWALAHLQGDAPEEGEEETIVVSGFPRSGTSLMMRCLQEGGISLLQDAKRAADPHNPRGYFEYAPIKDLARNSQALPPIAGRAVKVVAPLLRYLPPARRYCVLWMDRPFLEVILSQQKMKEQSDPRDFPFALALQYEAEEERLEQWLRAQPHLRWKRFAFADLIQNPGQTLQEVGEFLGRELNVSAAVKAVEPQLWRQKIG